MNKNECHCYHLTRFNKRNAENQGVKVGVVLILVFMCGSGKICILANMNIPTKKEMTWFVQRLIDIRNDTERTPTHIADIEFDYKEIIRQKSIFGNKTKMLAQVKIDEMLYLIKGDNIFLDGLNHFNPSNLSWCVLQNGNISIKGFQMEVLKAYMLEKILGVKKKNSDVSVDLDSYKIIYKKDGEFYINEDNGRRLLKFRKTTLYYRAFSTVYNLRPDGGTVSYSEFAGATSIDIKNRLRGKDKKKRCAIVRSYLTDPGNGFLRPSKIGEAEFNSKPLIECTQEEIIFNNKK